MPTKHTVQLGDAIESIAEEYGFFSVTLWDDSGNRELRELRKDPSVLAAGDVVAIPDRRPKTVKVAGGKRHVFKRKGVPVRFRMQLLDEDDEPRKVRYQLDIDGKKLEGKTNDEGWIEEWIAPRAQRGKLVLPDDDEEYELKLGHLEPVALESGQRARLRNLHLLGEEDDSAEGFAAAIRAFQLRMDLEPTEKMDDETRKKLVEAHRS
jgi:hypothetical protein